MRNLNFKLFGDAEASSLLLYFGWSVFVSGFFCTGNTYRSTAIVRVNAAGNDSSRTHGDRTEQAGVQSKK